jgi:hypothetical protein
MLKRIQEQRQQLQEQALKPLDAMRKALALTEDEQRFTELAEQQRDLAERMRALEGQSPENPATQRRIVELQAEQEEIRRNLARLLDDIERHAEALPPDSPEMEKLRESAEEFAAAVRASQAAPAMEAAEAELLRGQYTEAQAQAEAAARILEGFLKECQGMGQAAGQQCTSGFSPGQGRPDLRNAAQQLMNKLGRKPGSKSGQNAGQGFGTGPGGGYSSRSPGPQNVGLYGSLPTPQTSRAGGSSDKVSRGAPAQLAQAGPAHGSGTAAATARGDTSGQADAAVPSQYRAQVAEYFRRLSEELGSESSSKGTQE